MQQNKLKRVIPKTVYIFEFYNSENLFNCVIRLSRNKNIVKMKSDLYTFGKNYRLILYATASQKTVLPLASEFSNYVFSCLKQLNLTKEYGKIITKSNAIEKISKAL